MAEAITSRNVADQLNQYCSMFGRPNQMLTDNGPQYTIQAFKTGGLRMRRAPLATQEETVLWRGMRDISKGTLTKSSDMQLALLNFQTTPVDAKLQSPAEMLLGRP